MASYTSLSARSVRSSQTANESAPNASDAGVSLDRVSAVMPILRAPSGQTFTGAGAIRGWVQPPGLGRYVRAPLADSELPDIAGLAEAALPATHIDYSAGKFTLLCDGVGLSGAGGTIEIDFYCVAKSGRGEAL